MLSVNGPIVAGNYDHSSNLFFAVSVIAPQRPWKPNRRESDNVRKIKKHTKSVEPDFVEFLEVFGAGQKIAKIARCKATRSYVSDQSEQFNLTF